jgi:hypothetical protein
MTTGLVASACSSDSTSTTTTRPASTTTSSTQHVSTTTVTSRSTTTTGTPGTARCATGALIGAVTGSNGAAGTIETTVSLTSTATASCVLGGYPGLQLLGAGGSALPTTVVRKGNYSFTAMAPATVMLARGQAAYFNIGYSDVPVGSETTCPTSTSLEITPPNAFDHLTIPAALGPCGGGTLVVSPVFLATGSNSQSTAPPGP